MRGFLGLVILAGMFCAYWFVVAQVLRSAPDLLPERSAQAQSIAVSGFPLRFDISVARPALPARGWSAERLTLAVPSYWPFSSTGKLSGPQDLTWRGAHWQIDGPDLPLSVAVSPSLTLTHAKIEGHDLTLRGPLSGNLQSVVVSILPTDTPQARALTMALTELNLGALAVTSASVRAVLHMTVPPRLTRPQQLHRIEITHAQGSFGEIQVEATGTLERTPDGRLNGSLPLTVTNWRALFTMLQNAGVLPAEQAPMVMMMMQGMSNGDSLSLPLTITDSIVYLGPLSLLDLGRF